MRSVVGIGGRERSGAAGRTLDLVPLISQVRLAVIESVDEEFLRCEPVAKLGITAAQFSILRMVLKGGVQSACELCRRMDYDRGAMSRMIDRLETKHLLRRVPLAHTRRSVALEVTDSGKAALPVMEACLARVVERLLEGVSKAQVRGLEMVLKRMLSNA